MESINHFHTSAANTKLHSNG